MNAQVGRRSANSLSPDAIVYILYKRPLTTRKLHPEVYRPLPDLRDGNSDLVIKRGRFGERWKHAARNAQLRPKRNGVISLDGGRWWRAAAAPPLE